jgi:hypothetical protein
MNSSLSQDGSTLDNGSRLAYQGLEQAHVATTAHDIRRKRRSALGQWLHRNGMTLHRWVGIVALIPALLWSLSGTAHPFMAHWFKPPIAREFLPPVPIQIGAMQTDIATALATQNITSVKQVRIVQWNSAQYYQVQLPATPEFVYLDTRTGTALADGDKQYAVALAKQYLGNPNATLVSATLITSFDDDYRYINRLLPVWKISVAEGGYDVYIETSSGRMATYNTPLRRAFLQAFQYLHNWGWLNGMESLRLSVITLGLTIILVSALSGVVMYGVLWRKRRTIPAQGLRKYHRSIGLAVSLSTFMFASSGLYHALHKDRLHDEQQQRNYATQAGVAFSSAEIASLQSVVASISAPIFDMAFVRLRSTPYVRLTHGVQEQDKTNDCCTILSVPAQTSASTSAPSQQSVKAPSLRGATLIDLTTLQPLSRGDERYSIFVATELCALDPASIIGTQLVTEFKGEYGFINKRLPVWRVNFATPDHRSIYIEPQTATLAADVNDSDRREGFAFAYIHKLEFLKPLGKDVRDGTAVALGLLNSTVAILGLALFVRIKR